MRWSSRVSTGAGSGQAATTPREKRSGFFDRFSRGALAAWRLAFAAALTSAMSAGLAACRSDATTAAGCPGSEWTSPPVDEALMAFLSAARALHHEADVHERSGDPDGAIASLERLVALPAPHAVEADEVLADARARLAELRLARGDVQGAAREVEAGLERVKGPTYFRGHLLEVEGIVEEKRASTLADAGRTEEAARARARAVAWLEEAVHVQEGVIERALADGGSHD
jgi:tetratricopeptide (TPR) repeat protein